MMRLATSQVLASTVAKQRGAAAVIHQEGASRGLLAFRLADTHAHVLLLGTRADAGLFARYAAARLRARLQLAVPFERAAFRPIESQSHLQSAFRYILRQEERHEIALDPRHEASSAPDLLGMRLIAPGFTARVLEALPRLQVEELVSYLHLERTEPQLDRLPDAAAATLALPSLATRCPQAVAARAAAVQACPELSTAELAELLETSRRTVIRLRHQPVPEVLIEAVRRQLTIRPVRRPSRLALPGW